MDHWKLCVFQFAESSTVENGKLNDCPANGGPAEVKEDPDTDGTKQAFLPLEQEEQGQAKASVLEVFKKVNPRPVPSPESCSSTILIISL